MEQQYYNRHPPNCTREIPKTFASCPGLPPAFWISFYGKALAVITSILLQALIFGLVIAFGAFLIVSIKDAMCGNLYYFNFFIVGNILYIILWCCAWIMAYAYKSFEPPKKHVPVPEERNCRLQSEVHQSQHQHLKKPHKEDLCETVREKNFRRFSFLNDEIDFWDYDPPGQAPCTSPTKKSKGTTPKVNIMPEDYTHHCNPNHPCEYHAKIIPKEWEPPEDQWYTRLIPKTDDPAHDIQTYDTLHLNDPIFLHGHDREEYLERKHKEYYQNLKKEKDEGKSPKSKPQVDCMLASENRKGFCFDNLSKSPQITSSLYDAQEIKSKIYPCNPCHCGEERKVYTTKDQRGVRYETVPDCQSQSPGRPDSRLRKVPRFGPKNTVFQYFKTDANF